MQNYDENLVCERKRQEIYSDCCDKEVFSRQNSHILSFADVKMTCYRFTTKNPMRWVMPFLWRDFSWYMPSSSVEMLTGDRLGTTSTGVP